MGIRIHPSLLAADFANLESELAKISSADAVHVDVMDGHFVENLTFGREVVKRISEVSPVPLDVHLMIDRVNEEAPKYAELGVESVTFHVESARDVAQVMGDIKSNGSSVGMAFRPSTQIDGYKSFITTADLLLVMTVEPGAGGQEFLPETMLKLQELRYLVEVEGVSPLIQVDGGITPSTIKEAFGNGANTFVAGTSIFGGGIPAENIEKLRQSVDNQGGKNWT
jgi:ribulose-phosphate 3-epimerase